MPDVGLEPFVTEGDGYALLASAYMGDKSTFDGLWAYTHEKRSNDYNSMAFFI